MDPNTVELEKALNSLKLKSDQKSINQSLDSIIGVLEKEGCDRDVCVRSLLSAGLLPELCQQLQSSAADHEKTARCIAELVKTEESRVPCVEAGLVPPLVQMIDSKRVPECIQACRALGNICFDNDTGRDAIDQQDGVPKLVTLLKEALDMQGEGADKLRMVACGFLLNITNTHGMQLAGCSVQKPFSLLKMEPNSPTDAENIRMITLRINLDSNANQESVQEKTLGLGILDLLDSYLQKHVDDESVCQIALMSIGSLANSDFGKEKLCECNVLSTIANLLCTPTGQELQDMILDLLGNMAENDGVKVVLAKSKLKEHLLKVLQSCDQVQDEDSFHSEKLASDLLVLLLTGDVSMEILYGGGEGVVFKESLNWLSSPRDQLRVSGALAIGNFARNDAQCISLVQKGITEQLLNLLDLSQGDSSSLTLLHAVLSALRNLAIPAANKPEMLKCGLIERILPHTTADMAAVQFKLLGTLRMAIDGQAAAATTLGTNSTFLSRLIECCTVEEHAGVEGEANRLVALLVKHSRSSEVMRNIHNHGGIPHLVNMANSEHTLMQNEALVALTLISSSVLDVVSSSLASAELVPTLKVLLTESDPPPEIVCNVLSLLRAVTNSTELKQLLMIAEFPALVKKLQSSKNSNIQSQAKAVAAVLGKG